MTWRALICLNRPYILRLGLSFKLDVCKPLPRVRVLQAGRQARRDGRHHHGSCVDKPVAVEQRVRGGRLARAQLDHLGAYRRAILSEHRKLRRPPGRGIHSSAFQLNLIAVYGIGDACMGCVARVKGVFKGV